jgi:hypothetical protein
MRMRSSSVHPVFRFANLAEEFGDLIALTQDLGVGCLERVLAVQCPFAPGGFQRLALGFVALGPPSGGLRGGRGNDLPRFGIVIEEGSRYPGLPGDRGHGDRGLVLEHAVDDLPHSREAGLGAGAAGEQGAAGLLGRNYLRGGLHHCSSSFLFGVGRLVPAVWASSVARKAVDQMRWK